MTLDELIAREEIRHTLATYNKSGDADDADGFAACFTEGGVFDATGAYLEGREQIRAWKASHQLFSGGASGATAAFRVHHLTCIHIELLSPETARTRTGWIVITNNGVDHSGIYHDRFRRVGERWLIEKRVIDNLWRSEHSFISPEIIGCRSAELGIS